MCWLLPKQAEYTALTDKAIQSCKNRLNEGKNRGKKNQKEKKKKKPKHLEH